MSVTNRQWMAVSLAAVIAAMFAMGGYYRGVLVLFLPLGLWLGLKQESHQAEVRPWIRACGWLFVAFSIVAMVASLIVIAS